MLKKCPNITKVKLWIAVNNSVLSLIGQYCHRIKSLTHKLFTKDKSLPFFQQYGHKLEELYFYKNNKIIEQYLRHCPNLKTVFISDKNFRFPQDMEFLPKLQRIKSNITTFSIVNNSKDVKIIRNLSDKYSQRLKTFNVTLNELTAEELKTCIECIARFENLKEFTLRFLKIQTTEPIDNCLSLIGQKCNKLLKLDLYIHHSVLISDRFYDIFSKFKAIKKLKIELTVITNTVLSGSVECFKHCKQLNELDINYPELREDFFANIVSFVPKLQLIKIKSDQQFSDSFINPFHSMKCIQSVELLGKYKSKHKIWYFRKRY